jgi:hypothetical protein
MPNLERNYFYRYCTFFSIKYRQIPTVINTRNTSPGVGVRSLPFCDSGFESYGGHGGPSLVRIVCCALSPAVRSSGKFLPNVWCLIECDCESSIKRGPCPLGGLAPWKRNLQHIEIEGLS